MLCPPAGKQLGTAGYFVEPTIFADATDNMDIAKEEIFGPVLTALKWSTLDEVSSCLPVARLLKALLNHTPNMRSCSVLKFFSAPGPLLLHIHSLVHGMHAS